MSIKHLKRIALGCGFLSLFVWLWHTAILLTPSLTTETLIVKEEPLPQQNWHAAQTMQNAFDAEAFKRTIIDNNLFRPLGWTPPRPQEPYRLLGTIIPTDVKIPSRAIIQNTVGNQTYIVTIGDTLDPNTHVTNIRPKRVIVEKAGQQRTLTLNTTPLIK